MMNENLDHLKQQLPLLDYLRRRQWRARRASQQHEFVGLCPFHQETKPSFYVNAQKNLFYCHGCGRGGDLIRFLQLSLGLSFRQSVEHLKRELGQVANPSAELLEQTSAFYQCQLQRHAEAGHYLAQRGLRDPDLIQELGIGYAPGGNLLRHLASLGYPLDLLFQAGLINGRCHDTFCRRVIFPCSLQGRVINLYGRSIGAAFPHRFLPRPKGGLFAWEAVNQFSTIILVEGLFDLAVLWQAGFRNTTCAFGTHLTTAQRCQLCDRSGRQLYIAFDRDANHAGQQSAATLAQQLQGAGLKVFIAELPDGQDPNSYFVAGASAADFERCLDKAHCGHV
jgi:DNA primase